MHILNSVQYERVTEMIPPGEPPSAQTYNEAGLPWFDYYREDTRAVTGSQTLAGLDSVVAKGIKQGGAVLPGNEPVSPGTVVALNNKTTHPIREGEF